MENKTLGGVLIGLFMVIIVGLVLFQSSAQQVGDVVRTTSLVNDTVTAAASGSAVNLNGKEVTITDVRNGTVQFAAANYTALNNRIVNGAFATAQLQSDTTFIGSAGLINVTYTYEPFTYADDSGSRAMANLIPLLFALAILIVVLTPIIKEQFD